MSEKKTYFQSYFAKLLLINGAHISMEDKHMPSNRNVNPTKPKKTARSPSKQLNKETKPTPDTYFTSVLFIAESKLDVGVAEPVVVHGNEVTALHQHDRQHARPRLHLHLLARRLRWPHAASQILHTPQ